MPVDTRLEEYSKRLPQWQQVEDCVNDCVKSKGDKYLPRPSPSDESRENKQRFDQYLARAVFVNITKRTHDGLVGAVYRKDPTIELPANLEYMKDNSNSTGLGLTQFSKKVLSHTMQKGRGGILVDMPSNDGETVSETSDLQAKLVEYKAESIINWRTDENGALTLVVLLESYVAEDDGFQTTEKEQYRVLKMDDGVYVQEVWRDGVIDSAAIPKKSDGSNWDLITFSFVGTVNNDAAIDPSLLFSISELNVGHYRNSADLEENCFVHGQLTLGITSEMPLQEWKAANPSGVNVGSRAGHYLGRGGNFVSVQAEPNQLADNLMMRKEEQMLAIGAQVIQQGGQNETAEAVRANAGANSASLSSLAKNVSDAITQCLKWANLMMQGSESDEIVFELNQEFYPATIDAQMAAALIQLYDRGRIGALDLHRKLQSSGVIADDRDIEDLEVEAATRDPIGMPLVTPNVS